MIVKNLDNKLSFLFSEVSHASQEEKAKKNVSAARGTVGVRCTYKRVSTFYAFQSQIATRQADIYIFFVPFFFFFFFYSRNRFRKK